MSIFNPFSVSETAEIIKYPPRQITELLGEQKRRRREKLTRVSYCTIWNIPQENGEIKEAYVYEGAYYQYSPADGGGRRAVLRLLPVIIAAFIVQFVVLTIPSAFGSVRAVEFFEVGCLASLGFLIYFTVQKSRISGLMTAYEHRLGVENYRLALKFSAGFSLSAPVAMTVYLIAQHLNPGANELISVFAECLISAPVIYLFISEHRRRVIKIENDHQMPSGAYRISGYGGDN